MNNQDRNTFQMACKLEERARVYFRYYHFSDAEKLYRKALKLREETLGLSHPTVASVLYELGQTLCELGRYQEARPLFLRSVAIWEASTPNESCKLRLQAEIMENLERQARRATTNDTTDVREDLAS